LSMWSSEPGATILFNKSITSSKSRLTQ
jgi:hypothetical protein